jgi:hypothetical protein
VSIAACIIDTACAHVCGIDTVVTLHMRCCKLTHVATTATTATTGVGVCSINGLALRSSIVVVGCIPRCCKLTHVDTTEVGELQY